MATAPQTWTTARNSHKPGLIILISIGLVILISAVYLQVGNHQFIGFDDDAYVTKNIHVAGGLNVNNIIWAFTSFEEGNWHPVTWVSHMADVQLYGMAPRGHHLTSVAIHTFSSLLLLFLLARVTGAIWQSSFVAALFALHPLHVESVAWVAERKDVLSALFWFLTLLLYSEYAAKHKTLLYVLSLLSFVLGLMSKPMLVTLPVVMLLMDLWPLDRYKDQPQEPGLPHISDQGISLIKEKLPFFACSLISGVVTLYAQHNGGATSSLATVPLLFRVENSLVAYLKYLIMTLWPRGLAILYPITMSVPLWQVIGSLLALALTTAVVVRKWRGYPFLAVGWLWFLVTLAPVIGLIQVGSQAMADRYTYLPSIGLFITAAWGVPMLTKGLRHQAAILVLLASLVVGASALATWHQLGYWRDSISLFQHTLQVTSDNYVINANLGGALSEQGDLDGAIQRFNEALRINPAFATAHYNLGVTLVDKGDLDGAIQHYHAALRLNSNDPKTHYSLGVALVREGDVDGAIREYQAALRISPGDALSHYSLGVALIRKGDPVAAIREFRTALQVNPGDADARNNLGVALAKRGDLDAAIQEFNEVLRITPTDTFAQDNLKRALAQKSVTVGGGE